MSHRGGNINREQWILWNHFSKKKIKITDVGKYDSVYFKHQRELDKNKDIQNIISKRLSKIKIYTKWETEKQLSVRFAKFALFKLFYETQLFIKMVTMTKMEEMEPNFHLIP